MNELKERMLIDGLFKLVTTLLRGARARNPLAEETALTESEQIIKELKGKI